MLFLASLNLLTMVLNSDSPQMLPNYCVTRLRFKNIAFIYTIATV